MKTFCGNIYNSVKKCFEESCFRVVDGRVVPVENEEGALAMDGFIVPGFIDLHVHMREPGQTHKATFLSEGKAAAKGGFTKVFAMPNTIPAPDCLENMLNIRRLADQSVVPVELYGAATLGIKGETISDLEILGDIGCRFFSDDGNPISRDEHMLEIMQRLAAMQGILAVHEEDRSTFTVGAVNRGPISEHFRIDGIPNRAESQMIERDIALAEQTGTHLHICHVSCRESVDLIRQAKARGVKVSTEACPHHFAWTEELVIEKGALAKVNPPLRTKEDVQAVIKGLQDGTIDVIVTDHAPHDRASKELPIESASYGLSGIEFSFAMGYTYLVKPGYLTLEELIDKMSVAPARLFGLKEEGSLQAGCLANFAVLELDQAQTITEESMLSQGKNTPLIGYTLYGSVQATYLRGENIYEKA